MKPCYDELKNRKEETVIRFETDRLILRNYTMDDVSAVHEYFSDEEVMRYESSWPMTLDEVTEMLSRWKDMDNRMAVVLKKTGELIGTVGYWIETEGEETDYSLDYDFNRRFWHRGYATEAAKEVVRHLIEDLHVKKIWGDCDDRNTASAKLFERLGFRHVVTEDTYYKEDENGKPIMIKVRFYQLTV